MINSSQEYGPNDPDDEDEDENEEDEEDYTYEDFQADALQDYKDEDCYGRDEYGEE